jgi:hypothetical protein
MNALYRLLKLCNTILVVTSAKSSENRDELDKMKLETVETLSELEAVLPKTELPVMLHIMLHLPDAIHRWNHVRNYWSFFGERCMGWLIRFVHNRDLAVENIMTAYVRLRFVLSSPPGTLNVLSDKLMTGGVRVPAMSVLQRVSQILNMDSTLPGLFPIQLSMSCHF